MDFGVLVTFTKRNWMAFKKGAARILRFPRIRLRSETIPRYFKEISEKITSRLSRLSQLPLLNRRSLVGRILLMNVVWVMLIYGLAVIALWWTSTRIIEDNLQRQALQWVSELDEMGTPLYASTSKRNFSRIERHVKNFPQIAYLRYYDATGKKVLGEYRAQGRDQLAIPNLGDVELKALGNTTKPQKPHRFDDGLEGMVRTMAPVWIKSIENDGLIGFDVHGHKSELIKVIGFIDLGLDVSQYREQLARGILIGSLLILALLVLSVVGGRKLIKRTLSPLSDLKKPLARLARGETDISVSTSGDEEIAVIGKALNATISALKEREELRKLADHDHLTGLVNRHYFGRELERELLQAGKGGEKSALLFVDLDEFKYVNDTLGHAAGDRLLIQVADTLKTRMRDQDVICRFGGDEFTILARNVDRRGASGIARSIIENMQTVKFQEGGQTFHIYCSVGVAMIDNDRFTSEELLSQADSACYAAKAAGRNRYHISEIAPLSGRKAAEDIGWSRKLEQVITRDSFVLHYQPIVTAADSRPVLYEVLLRMPGRGKELLPPKAFLPAANRLGFMVGIDQWVIRRAATELAEHRRSEAEICYSINLSDDAFEDPGLVQCVKDSLELNDLPPHALVFEITEQAAVRHMDKINLRIQELADLGCRFALEDFGAGFSSFSYIRNLPVHFVKIKGKFVENLSRDNVDRVLVQSMVQVAQSIGKEVIAEYVQDAGTLEILRTIGVDYLQGHYIGKPVADVPRTPALVAVTSSRSASKHH